MFEMLISATVLLHQVMRDDTKKAHPFSGQALRGLKADATHPWRHENLRRLLLTSVINWQDVLVRDLQVRGFFRLPGKPYERPAPHRCGRHAHQRNRRPVENEQVRRRQLVKSCEAQKLAKKRLLMVVKEDQV